MTREPCPADRRATLVTFTELGRTTAQASFDAGLSHVIDRLRALLYEAPQVGTAV